LNINKGLETFKHINKLIAPYIRKNERKWIVDHFGVYTVDTNGSSLVMIYALLFERE